MHAGAVLAVAGLEDARMRAQTGPGGQQRRVDVEQPPLEAVDEGVAEDAHVACAHHPVRFRGSHGIGQLDIEIGSLRVTAGVAAPAQRRRHALQGACRGTIAEDADDAGGEATVGDGVEQGLQVGAAAGGEDGDAGKAGLGTRDSGLGHGRQAMRTRSLPATAVTTWPMRRWARPRPSSSVSSALAPSAAATSTKPMPQLKVRHISSRGPAPSRCSHSKTGGSAIAEASMSRPRLSGTTRMMFSVRPPPVMWAMAWIVPPLAPRSRASTGFTYSAVGA